MVPDSVHPASDRESAHAGDGAAEPCWRHALHWSIASPPLLSAAALPTAQHFSASEYQRLWQQAPLSPPETLPPELAAGRLGRLFERWWQFWLQQQDDWQFCAANVPVRSLQGRGEYAGNGPAQSSRVAGELDLLVRNASTAALEHWELAVKFYLGVGDPEQPAHWLGPSLNDSLAGKLQRLQQQLGISATEAGAATLTHLGWRVDAMRAVIKGRLYHPLENREAKPAFADPAHLRGVWADAAGWRRWLQQRPASQARPFARADWLAGTAPAMAWQPFVPEPVASLQSFELDNGWRVLVMPDDWLMRAQAALANRDEVAVGNCRFQR